VVGCDWPHLCYFEKVGRWDALLSGKFLSSCTWICECELIRGVQCVSVEFFVTRARSWCLRRSNGIFLFLFWNGAEK
jgi:hypothetical protein